MPKIVLQSRNVVTFTASDVWNALRKTYPEAGMPEKYNPADSSDNAPRMCVDSELGDVAPTYDRANSNFDFESDDEGIIVIFLSPLQAPPQQPPQPKREPQRVRLRVWEEFKTDARCNTLPAPVYLEDGIGRPNNYSDDAVLIGKVVAVHGPVYKGADTSGTAYTLVDADVMVEPEHLELVRKHEVKARGPHRRGAGEVSARHRQ